MPQPTEPNSKESGKAAKTARQPKPESLVPDSFMLAGTIWTVKRVVNHQELGQCHRDTATIELRDGLPRQVEETTFFHELIHAILYTMGVDDNQHTEREIDAAGAFLHQFMLTRR